MKKIILSIAFSVLTLASFAQTNPTVTAASVNPDPIPGATPYATLEFVFANLDPDPIGHMDPDGNPDPMVLKVSLQNGTYDDVNYADPIAAIGGDYANHFDWVYDPVARTYTGTQNQPVPGGDGGTITIAYKVTTATLTTSPNNGFTVNLTSNGNAPNGPGTNDPNDDDAKAVTYVNGPLPVTLTSFSVQKEGQTAQLKWATTAESNSDRFEIEHSLNGKNWSKIGAVASTGESTVLINYSFVHENPSSGENLYRLKMIDHDETFAYSRIQSVKFDGVRTDLSIYPNPVTDKLLISNYSKVKEVTLNNTSGTALFQGGNMSSDGIDVSKLLPGIYIVTLTLLDGTISTHKVAVTR
jgi:hypothetical protein